jgi:hypothetical protein
MTTNPRIFKDGLNMAAQRNICDASALNILAKTPKSVNGEGIRRKKF